MQQSDKRELTNEIRIRATQEARTAYEAQRFQVMVEIDDDDRDGEPVTRLLKYNLPEEYVRLGEIKLDPNHEVVEAKFILIPVSSDDGS
jgi:hypothetical protein